MLFNFDSALLSIATAIVIFTCFLAPLLFKKELKGFDEKYYLIAFYISAFIHFITVVDPTSATEPFGEVSKFISVINGSLLSFWVSAFVCKREKKNALYYVLIVLVIANLAIQSLYKNPIYFSVFIAFLSNLIGFLVVALNVKNKADWGLALCFGSFSLALMAVLFEAPLDVTASDFYSEFYAWLLIFIPGFICGVTIFIFLRFLLELNHELKLLAHTDALTGLSTRRFALDIIENQLAYLNRTKSSASLVMSDIDNFKHVNDTYGHQAGDLAIQTFATVISDGVRDYDIACRYGGEEFMLFLPDTGVIEAQKIVERIRLKLKDATITSNEHEFSITSSFGISAWIPKSDIQDVINEADKALYKAKANGRDQSVVASNTKSLLDSPCQSVKEQPSGQ